MPKPKTKTEDWEKELEEIIPKLLIYENIQGGTISCGIKKDVLKSFISQLLKTQRLEIVRELDKKYNKICEEKVRETAQDIVGEIEKEIYMVDYIKDKDGEWKNWQQQKRVLTALKQKYGK